MELFIDIYLVTVILNYIYVFYLFKVDPPKINETTLNDILFIILFPWLSLLAILTFIAVFIDEKKKEKS